MTANSLTHRDLANALDVSVTTIKSYRRKFPGFVPVAGFGKPIRFRPRALEVCTKIRECFVQGLSVPETEKRLKQAGFRSENASKLAPGNSAAPSAGSSPQHSEEYLEKFFQTAGQMMHGMAQLATAQARSEVRLSKLENVLKGLLEADAGNKALLTELAAGIKGEEYGAANHASPPILSPEEMAAVAEEYETAADELDEVETSTEEQPPITEKKAGTPEPVAEEQPRTRKIVNVRSKEGQVDTYAFDNGAEDISAVTPPHSLLELPVAIRSEQGDYLGLPGRLSLEKFKDLVVDAMDTTQSITSQWDGVGNTWTLRIKFEGGRRELGFSKVTTERGIDLAVLLHLNRDGAVADRTDLMEYFRQFKDLETAQG